MVAQRVTYKSEMNCDICGPHCLLRRFQGMGRVNTDKQTLPHACCMMR
jgi:hypothetical protein